MKELESENPYIKTLIRILKEHGFSSVIIDGLLYVKSICTYFGMTFIEYEYIGNSNIYEYLGY